MDTVPASDDPLLVRALGAAERSWRRGKTAHASWILHMALVRAEARGDRSGVLATRQLLGHLAFEAGDYTVAEAHHRLVLMQSRAMGLRLGRASALHCLGLVAAAAGRQRRARRLFLVAVAHYERLGHAAGARAARANLALFIDHWSPLAGAADDQF